MIQEVPRREDTTEYQNIIVFSRKHLGLSPDQTWKLTWAEFWPLYNDVMGKTMRPLSKDEFDSQYEQWASGGKVGNS